jgi:cytochrome c5
MSKPAIAVAMVALSLIAMRALAADPPATSATPAAPPPGPGLDLINQRCGFCHSTAQVFTQHKSADAWAATVQAMADRGAEVSPDEMKVIVDYLSKNYPAAPGAAPPAASH